METKSSPYLKANCVSRLFYCWVDEIIKRGRRHEINLEDVYDVHHEDSSEFLCNKLEKHWRSEQKKARDRRTPSLRNAIARAFGPYVLVWSIVFVLEEAVRICCPFLIGGLIKYFVSDTKDLFTATMFAMGICICSIIPTIVHHPYFLAVLQSGMRMRISCCTLIYKKMMRLDIRSLKKVSIGQVINIISNDVARFDMSIGLLPFLIVGPLEVIVVLILLWFYIGWSGICGMAVLLLAIPFTGALAKVFAKLSSEIKTLYKAGYVRGITLSTSFFSIKLVILFTFLTYVLTGNIISAEVVFVTMSLYNPVKLSMTNCFPMAMQYLAETLVTIAKIQDFLLLEERHIPLQNEGENINNHDICVKATDITIAWNEDKIPILRNLNFDAIESDLFMIVGPVGSGKTALLLAILKELPIFQGKLSISGNIAFVPQSPWIFNSSIKNNIIMGLPSNKEFYSKVLKYAALEKDLECLPEKDETIVGERGMSLSGGQKARIALARALYMDSDIYLLDSPLSAVDANVGHFLFHRCINGFIAKKLRILVTHQLQYLSYANKVLITDKHKKHVYGTYHELLAKGIDFAEILKELNTEKGTETKEIQDSNDAFQVDFASSKNMSKSLSHLKERHSGELQERLLSKSNDDINLKNSNSSATSATFDVLCTQDVPNETYQHKIKNQSKSPKESMSSSSISLKLYTTYFKSGGGILACICCILLNVLAQTSFLITDWWLAHWCQSVETFTKEGENQKINMSYLCSPNSLCHNVTNITKTEPAFPHTHFYLGIFALLSVLVVLLGLVRAIQFFHMAISSSNNLHRKMLHAVIMSPMTFFVDTPTGQILNRFSKDLGQIDDYLPLLMFDFMQSLFQVVGVFLVVTMTNPWVILAVIPILICFFIMRNYFLQAFINIKRLEATSKSPVFSHVNSTFQGLHTIRCHKSEEHFIKVYNSLQDVNTSAFSLFLFMGRWFAVRLEWLCTLLVCIVAFTSLLAHHFVTGALIGLSLSYVMTLLVTFQWVVRQNLEVQGLMALMERIHEYSKLPIEDVKSNDIPPRWPENGKIDFKNVTLKYQSKASDALHHVTFTITPGERVGVVGRTGAGKSSLINVLFRLFDFEGTVMIDEVDHCTINLHHLRKKLSIIPQDPTLFAGLLRTNLDPLAQHSDPQLWHALKKVDMDETIREMKKGLYFVVQEGGKNLSVGQRQLLCMARALLENNKILIIDEATANVDRVTDSKIQKKLREEFANCTIFSIAHRLNTIIDYDKIMVLESGSIKEYDTPYDLMQKPDGALRGLAKQNGEEEYKNLLNATRRSANTKA